MLRVQHLFVSNNEDCKGPFSIRRNGVLKVAGLVVSKLVVCGLPLINSPDKIPAVKRFLPKVLAFDLCGSWRIGNIP